MRKEILSKMTQRNNKNSFFDQAISRRISGAFLCPHSFPLCNSQAVRKSKEFCLWKKNWPLSGVANMLVFEVSSCVFFLQKKKKVGKENTKGTHSKRK